MCLHKVRCAHYHQCGYLRCFGTLGAINANYPAAIRTQITDIYHKYLVSMHIGQGLDIRWTSDRMIPSVEEYNTMMDWDRFRFAVQ